MRKQAKKIVSIILIAVMALVPLQTSFAMNMISVDQEQQLVLHEASAMNEQGCAQSCDNCTHQSCCQNHSCQCFYGSSAVVLYSFAFNARLVTLTIPARHSDSLIIASSSSPFRPPRV